jgi:hypothetical protein
MINEYKVGKPLVLTCPCGREYWLMVLRGKNRKRATLLIDLLPDATVDTMSQYQGRCERGFPRYRWN